MGLRPGRTVRALERPWTRYSTKKTKSYVPTMPGSKLHQFVMGEDSDSFDITLNLVAKESGQIRNNAIESARIVSHHALDTELPKGFFMKILLYPHHVIREKPLAQGAGADRYSMGMKLAFGKPTTTAVQIKKGQTLIRLKTRKSNLITAKSALKKASSKLPVPMRIIVDE